MLPTTAQLDQYVTRCNGYRLRILRLIEIMDSNDNEYHQRARTRLDLVFFNRTNILVELRMMISDMDQSEDRNTFIDIINTAHGMINDVDHRIRRQLKTLSTINPLLPSFITHSTDMMIAIIMMAKEKFVNHLCYNQHIGLFYVHKMTMSNQDMIESYQDIVNAV